MTIIAVVISITLYTLFLISLDGDDENMWPDEIFDDEEFKE